MLEVEVVAVIPRQLHTQRVLVELVAVVLVLLVTALLVLLELLT